MKLLNPLPLWTATSIIVLATGACLEAADRIATGTGQIRVDAAGQQLDVFTYKPASYRDGPLVVVCHGMLRNAGEYRDRACSLADRLGAVVVAPRFDDERFPVAAFQHGGILKDGAPQPPDAWTVSLLDPLVETIRRREGKPEWTYYLIGHSAGGQFLSRLAGMTTSGSRRIVLANPGTHLFPTRELPFPYGFGELPAELSDDAALRRYLAQPVTIYLGTDDLKSENLPQGKSAMTQGATRYDRGKRCFALAAEVARENSWPFHWRLVEAKGVGHDSQAMFDHGSAVQAMLGDAGTRTAD